MIDTGWIKLSRKITSWRWYKDQNTFRVFLHLLINANAFDNDFEGITIHRGEFLTTYSQLSKDLSISIRESRTAISHLISTGEVTAKKFPKYTVYSIKNYFYYQQSTCIEPTNRQSTDNQSTVIRQQHNKDKNIYYFSSSIPKLKDVINYAYEIEAKTDPNLFFEHYEKLGWKIGGDKIKDWKALFRSWDRKNKEKKNSPYKNFYENIENIE